MYIYIYICIYIYIHTYVTRGVGDFLLARASPKLHPGARLIAGLFLVAPALCKTRVFDRAHTMFKQTLNNICQHLGFPPLRRDFLV